MDYKDEIEYALRHSRASAAVPEGALPPLPMPWYERTTARRGGYDENCKAMAAMQAEIAEWRARAAVEADRAQRPENASQPLCDSAMRAEPAANESEPARAWMMSHGYGNQTIVGALTDLQARIEKKNSEGMALALRLMTAEERLSAATRCRAEGGDGAPEAVDVLADRAQQGEPVDERAAYEAWELEEAKRRKGEPLDADERAYVLKRWPDDRDTYNYCPHHWPAFKAGYHAATKAAAPADAWTAEQIAEACVRAGLGILECNRLIVTLKRAAPVPDTGIPTAGDLDKVAQCLHCGKGVPEIDNCEDARFCNIAMVAPVSSTPTSGAVEKWHAPGLGEVHSHDHKYQIECLRDIDDPDRDYVADDELAKHVCAALNAYAGAAPVHPGEGDAP